MKKEKTQKKREWFIAYCYLEYYTKAEMKKLGYPYELDVGWSKSPDNNIDTHSGRKPHGLSHVTMKFMHKLFHSEEYEKGLFRIVVLIPDETTDEGFDRYTELLDEAEAICKEEDISYKRFEIEV